MEVEVRCTVPAARATTYVPTCQRCTENYCNVPYTGTVRLLLLLLLLTPATQLVRVPRSNTDIVT